MRWHGHGVEWVLEITKTWRDFRVASQRLREELLWQCIGRTKHLFPGHVLCLHLMGDPQGG